MLLGWASNPRWKSYNPLTVQRDVHPMPLDHCPYTQDHNIDVRRLDLQIQLAVDGRGVDKNFLILWWSSLGWLCSGITGELLGHWARKPGLSGERRFNNRVFGARVHLYVHMYNYKVTRGEPDTASRDGYKHPWISQTSSVGFIQSSRLFTYLTCPKQSLIPLSITPPESSPLRFIRWLD